MLFRSRATGMIFDKKNQTLQLLSRVKVHYEKPFISRLKAAKPSKKAVLPINKMGLSANKTVLPGNKATAKSLNNEQQNVKNSKKL